MLRDDSSKASVAHSPSPRADGPVVTVHGFLDDTLGVGEAARLYVRALRHAGLEVRTRPLPLPRLDPAPVAGGPTAVTGEVSLVCVNGPEVLELERRGFSFDGSSANIAVWAWETDVVPDEWVKAATRFDEVWVASRYEAEVLGPALPVPVRVVPFPVLAPEAGTDGPAGTTGAFTFLFAFDFLSTVQRKNPLAVIRAFTTAFLPGEGPVLVLKSINGDQRPEALECLRWEARDRPDVRIVDQHLDRAGFASVLSACDCYVSLHRSEGFGLVIAEAMALGKPVISTGWSGNTDFTHEGNSYVVRHRLTEVSPEVGHYPAGATWAEPDIEHAAELMREVWLDEPGRRQRADAGREEVRRRYSLDTVAAKIAAGVRRAVRPPLSVIVATTHPWPVSRRCLDILIPQVEEAGGQLILADGDGHGVPDDLVESTPCLTVVRQPGASVFELRALATRQADGRIIAFTEDHCVPHPAWCARTLAAQHAHPEAGVIGGAVSNGSRERSIDWANFIMTFAAFVPPVTPQPDRSPVGANMSLKRSVVDDWSDVAAGWVEVDLVPGLHDQGRVVLDDSFAVEHVQSFGVPKTLVNHFHNGRSTGGFMAPMPWRQRRAVLRSCLTRPPQAFRFTMRMCEKTDELRRESRRAAPYIACLAVAQSVGLITGLLAGPGNSPRKLE